jgi:curved DNA-binding protein CbpA
VKRAFRSQIAKYHPDKVQHLGPEFQAMATDRATELTEAYRVLSDEARRAEYDRAIAANGAAAHAPASTSAASAGSVSSAAQPSTAATPPPNESSDAPRSTQFVNERATRDEFVRKAAMNRLRQALDAVATGYDRSEVRGFDVALVPRKKLFGSSKNPKLLGRFVDTVDRAAVADAWTEASKWGAAEDVCVLLMGTTLASAGELATEIRDQSRRQRGGKLVLIPVDARDWGARMPLDAPPIAKTLVERLKRGA